MSLGRFTGQLFPRCHHDHGLPDSVTRPPPQPSHSATPLAGR
jgi:hypothetical protein